MKKILYFLPFFIFFSCKKDKNIEHKEDYVYEEIKINEMSVGEYHNYILASNLKKAQTLHSNRELSNQEIIKVLQEDFKFKIINDLKINEQKYVDFIKKTKIILSEEEYLLTLNKSLKRALSEIEKSDKTLSNDLRKLAESVPYDNYQKHLEIIDTLRNKYKGSKNYNFVAMICDVSLSSYKFWSENNTTIYVNTMTQRPPNYNSVWQADVSGAIIGGTWGGITGSFAGGIGAVPGAFLGGSIASSYGSAAAGIWWLFNNK